MKKVAVILSGCGVLDGSEIHESVACMLALTRAGVAYQCLAPNILQTQAINHLNQEKLPEVRQVLAEAARLARGDIRDIASVSANDFSAALYPGGYGAAVNLCDFASSGVGHHVQTDVLNFAQQMATTHKPQGFICIAPILIAKIYGPGVNATIGSDPAMVAAMLAMGNHHQIAQVTDIIIDETHKVVSTPAYMLANNIADVFTGIERLVQAVLALRTPS